jgi:hypothetical protein
MSERQDVTPRWPVDEEMTRAVRTLMAERDRLQAEVERLREALEESEPCRIVEYDGAFKCLEHGRTWGAISDPDEPCALADREPTP